MISNFKPTWTISKIYNIAPSELKNKGIKAIFTDLDNTLIPWNSNHGYRKLSQWQNRLKENNILLLIVSNNKYSRVSEAANNLKLPYICRALKPFSYGIKKGLKEYNLNDNQVVMIGDQLLTDIWAANNLNIKSILVNPLIKSDSWNTQINRFFERKIKEKLKKKYNLLQWKKDFNDKF